MSEDLRTLPRYAFDQHGSIYGPVDAGDGTFIRHEDLEAALAEVEARAPQEQAVIAELAAHIQTARRALADPRTERSILSAGVALDEAFQVLEGRPPVVGFLDGGDTPQEPPRHVACHDLVCNGDKSKPRGTPMSGCSCRGREERTHGELMEAREAGRDTPPEPPRKIDNPRLIEQAIAISLMLDAAGIRAMPIEAGVRDIIRQRDELLEAREARAVPPLDWHPIETAPKDARILAVGPGEKGTNAPLIVWWWDGNFQNPAGWRTWSGHVYPTHWMPLPQAPVLPQDQEAT